MNAVASRAAIENLVGYLDLGPEDLSANLHAWIQCKNRQFAGRIVGHRDPLAFSCEDGGAQALCILLYGCVPVNEDISRMRFCAGGTAAFAYAREPRGSKE